jgi:Zn-dependent metalloprotease
MLVNQSCRCLNCITPPYLLKKLLESSDGNIREAALNTLLATAQLRGERSVRGSAGFLTASGGGRRTVFDCRNGVNLAAANVVRSEDGEVSNDESVNLAFEGLGTTRDFFQDVFDRDSIDGQGMRLNGFVHRGSGYNNAFWDGREMVFGDGDNRIFTDFTKSLDVIAHELTHGVTEFTAQLEYHLQSGALNESISDVFGSMVKQWSMNQSVDEADWLIGSEVFTPNIEADALRSVKAPGTAYNNNLFGKDPQPDHMSKFVVLPDTEAGDWGGVHVNSGIPNKAFYLTAMTLGGFAWEEAGQIWYEALLASSRNTQFQDFADTTYIQAGQMYGSRSSQQQAVTEAWKEVGIRIRTTSANNRVSTRGRSGGISDGDSLAALTSQIESLANQVKILSKDVNSLKDKR